MRLSTLLTPDFKVSLLRFSCGLTDHFICQAGDQLTLSITGMDGISKITTRTEVFIVIEEGIHDGFSFTNIPLPPILNPREPPTASTTSVVKTETKENKTTESNHENVTMTPEEIAAAKYGGKYFYSYNNWYFVNHAFFPALKNTFGHWCPYL